MIQAEVELKIRHRHKFEELEDKSVQMDCFPNCGAEKNSSKMARPKLSFKTPASQIHRKSPCPR